MAKHSSCNNQVQGAGKGRRRQGVALALVVVAIVILFAAGAGLMHLGLEGKMQAIRSVKRIEARCAADAGLTEAIWAMNEQLKIVPWNDGTLPSASDTVLPGSDGTYTYTVTGDVASGYAVESVGNSAVASKTVYCGLGAMSVMFEYPLFNDGAYDIWNQVDIDGYDSSLGDYGGSNQGSTSLGTNSAADGAIDIGNNSNINGDVAVGPGGDPADVITGDTGAVSGETYAAPEAKELPNISAPALAFQGAEASGTISASGQYGDVDLGNNAKLTIDGDVVLHITGDVVLSNGASIEITEGSSLVLYLDGDFDSSNNGYINNLTKSPPACRIYSTATTAVNYGWTNNSVFYGAVYAPLAEIEVLNCTEMYGALVGNNILLRPNSAFHGDAALQNGSIGDPGGVKFVRSRWRE